MTDEYNQRLQEEQDDAALELLMNEYAEIEGEALWREFQAAEAAGNGPDAQTRENRESSRGSTEKNRRKDFLLRIGKCMKRAAIIFLALICILSPLAMSVEAFKIPVIDYILTLKQAFSAFDFSENYGMSQEMESVIKLIQAVPCPEKCIFSKQTITSDGKVWLSYEREGNLVMRITIYPSKGQINIDTEDVAQIPMNIYNTDVVYIQKDGHRLMWMDAKRNLVFDIHAYALEEEEFWRYTYRLIENMSN